ncbi:MAG: hypothetical protein MJ198_06040 [Bacteroidales bacterium]|nr:hypothetical protein [Bacteroidales bacterium]
MKKVLLLFLLVFPTMIYATEGYSFLNTQSSEENIFSSAAPVRQQQFALGHIGMSLYPDFSLGVTYGQVRVFGWYANLTTDFGFKFSTDYKADAAGYIDGEYPFYTGNKKTSYFALSAGYVVRMEIPSYNIPIYLLGGLGYGNRTVRYEMEDGSWASWKTSSSPRSGLRWEFMAMTSFDDIAVSAGISSVTNFNRSNFFELKIGGGYFF